MTLPNLCLEKRGAQLGIISKRFRDPQDSTTSRPPLDSIPTAQKAEVSWEQEMTIPHHG